jgi:hypothetical protein
MTSRVPWARRIKRAPLAEPTLERAGKEKRSMAAIFRKRKAKRKALSDKLTPEAAKIVEEVREYLELCEPDPAAWYVGISAEPKERLFGFHRVRESFDNWLFRTASAPLVAREVRLHLMGLGMTSQRGSIEPGARTVYLYRRTSHTREADAVVEV